MIGTPEAQYITNKESGVGFLRVGMEDPVKFSTLYTGAPLRAAGRGPEPTATAASRGAAPRAETGAHPPVHRGAGIRRR